MPWCRCAVLACSTGPGFAPLVPSDAPEPRAASGPPPRPSLAPCAACCVLRPGTLHRAASSGVPPARGSRPGAHHRARASRRVCCRAPGALYRARGSAAASLGSRRVLVRSTGPSAAPWLPLLRDARRCALVPLLPPRFAPCLGALHCARGSATAPLMRSTGPSFGCRRCGWLYRARALAAGALVASTGPRFAPWRSPLGPRLAPCLLPRRWRPPPRTAPEFRALACCTGPRLGCRALVASTAPEVCALSASRRAADALHPPELRLPRPGASTAPLVLVPAPRPSFGCRALVVSTAPEARLPGPGACTAPELRLPWGPPRARASAAGCARALHRAPGGLHWPEARAAPCSPRPSFGRPGAAAGVLHRPELRLSEFRLPVRSRPPLARGSRRALVPLPRRWRPPPKGLRRWRASTGPRFAPRPGGVHRARGSAAAPGWAMASEVSLPCPGPHHRARGSRRFCRPPRPSFGCRALVRLPRCWRSTAPEVRLLPWRPSAAPWCRCRAADALHRPALLAPSTGPSSGRRRCGWLYRAEVRLPVRWWPPLARGSRRVCCRPAGALRRAPRPKFAPLAPSTAPELRLPRLGAAAAPW